MNHRIALPFLAATLVVGAASFTPPFMSYARADDPKSDQPVTDTWITTKVKAELATTEGVKSTEISVKTIDGKVILIGVLPTQVAVDKAVAAARGVKGVRDVDDAGLKVK
ncbi:BON domain-containing protein [Dokdonella sp.]|uniref:BON domain-containing protein n=1 Tax=Dokdonella sp. TaxID=2291710 RepID=UPI0037834C3A